MYLIYDIIPPEMKKRKTTIKRRNKSHDSKRAIFRTACMVFIVAVSWLGLMKIGSTGAFMNDTELSMANLFIAGALDFSIAACRECNRFAVLLSLMFWFRKFKDCVGFPERC